MRILIALTYYRPHVSGVTVYAERLARGLAARGHQVTVLTSRFAPHLPARETIDAVDVVRVPVRWKISKGAVMPLFPAYAALFTARCDVVNVHVPQFEAALLTSLGRALRRPVVLTYHCDLCLPSGWFNRMVESSLVPLNHLAAQAANAIVINTADYGSHSPFLARYRHKLHAITPPIDMAEPEASATARLAESFGLNGHVRIGFAARFAAEKGVEYLLRALPALVAEFPDLRVVFTGAYKDTVGEEAYLEKLRPLLQQYEKRLMFLDVLSAQQMPSFFAMCDVLAVTSLNSTESFGLVQAESMLAGTPVVATDLPGVREAIRRTGMGRIVPPHDPAALASALSEVIRNRSDYRKPPAEVRASFDLATTLDAYEALFHTVGDRARHRRPTDPTS